MYDVVTVGSATQDIFFVSAKYEIRDENLQLVWGEKQAVEDLVIDVGGGGCNAAVGLARLGLKTAFWGEIGPDLGGELVAKRLSQEGVSKDFLSIGSSHTATSAIFLVPGGEHSIVTYRGSYGQPDPAKINLKNLLKTKWLYLAGMGDSSLVDKAVRAGVKIAFLPGRVQIKQGLGSIREVIAQSNVLILNAVEAAQLLGQSGDEFVSSDRKCLDLVSRVEEMLVAFGQLGAKKVVITRDICGIQAFDGDHMYTCPPPQVDNLIDTTGAGDAFSCGFVAAQVNGKSLDESLDWGSRNAGAVISMVGAQTGLLYE